MSEATAPLHEERLEEVTSAPVQVEKSAAVDSPAATIADASPAAWVSYSIAVLMAWAYLAGYVEPGALIYMAAISAGALLPYMGGAITTLRKGNAVAGITWLYFGAFFAGAAALNYFISWLAFQYDWAVDGRIQGYMWLVLGVLLLGETPIFMKWGNTATAIVFITVDIGVIGAGFVFLGYGGSVLADISAWALFTTGVVGVICAVAGILENVGWKVPLGPPWLK